MATVIETDEEIVSSEIARLHFNGSGGSLGWPAVMIDHGTDKQTIAMHQLLLQEMASYSGVEGKIRRLFGGLPVLTSVEPSVLGRFHRGTGERFTVAGNPVMVLEFDEAGEAFDPGQQDALADWVRPLWGRHPRIVTAVHSLPDGTNLDAWFLSAFGHAVDRVHAAPQFGEVGRLMAGVYVSWRRPDGRSQRNPPLRRLQGSQRLAYKIVMSCQAANG